MPFWFLCSSSALCSPPWTLLWRKWRASSRPVCGTSWRESRAARPSFHSPHQVGCRHLVCANSSWTARKHNFEKGKPFQDFKHLWTVYSILKAVFVVQNLLMFISIIFCLQERKKVNKLLCIAATSCYLLFLPTLKVLVSQINLWVYDQLTGDPHLPNATQWLSLLLKPISMGP